MRSLLTIAWLFIVLIARQAAAGACPATPATCNPLLNSTYISTAFTQSRAQVEAHTRRSFDALLKRTNSKTGFLTESDNAFWTSQNGWTAIADYDALRGTKLYAQQVSVAQDTMAKGTGPGVPLVNAFNDDAGWAALANLRAYAAYGDKKYLDRATEYLDTQVITAAVLQKGYTEGTKSPDAKVQATCDGKSMIGGVYWVNGLPHHPQQAASTGLNAVSTGLYSLLSAELCQVNRAQTEYCDKAYRSMQWLDRHLVAPDGLLWDNLSGKSCKVQREEGWKFTYNAGLYISTYALLSNLTSNSTALSLAESTAKVSLSTSRWNGANGIIKEESGDPKGTDDGISFRSVVVRALYRSYRYFKDEQYYGLTQLNANSGETPVEFGRNWNGPKFEVSTWQSQIAAMDVLNAIHLNPASAFRKKDRAGVPVVTQRQRAAC